jgi:hypothetical protein
MPASITFLSTSRKPGALATIPSSVAREFWAAESRRVGSDWKSVGELVAAILHRLAATSSSWGSPCR